MCYMKMEAVPPTQGGSHCPARAGQELLPRGRALDIADLEQYTLPEGRYDVDADFYYRIASEI